MIKIVTINTDPKLVLIADSETDAMIGGVRSINIYMDDNTNKMMASLTMDVDKLESYDSIEEMQAKYLKLKKDKENV